MAWQKNLILPYSYGGNGVRNNLSMTLLAFIFALYKVNNFCRIPY